MGEWWCLFRFDLLSCRSNNTLAFLSPCNSHEKDDNSLHSSVAEAVSDKGSLESSPSGNTDIRIFSLIVPCNLTSFILLRSLGTLAQ